MSSPISSALAKLDDCLQLVQVQVEYLRSGLEVDDAQLTTALEHACQNAAEVRELIRAERSDANWNTREALDGLILELQIAAHERRNQELRTRLLELADELEAGTVKHRSEARTNALNALRQEAIQELRAEAAIPEQTKELPGPEASEWLHWACNLEEGKDVDALQCLRTEFGALDQFAGEMEENYWTPGDRVPRSSAPPTSSTAPRRPSPPAYTPPRPSAPTANADYARSSLNVGGRSDAPQGPNYATAVARAYDRSSNAAPAVVEARRPEPSGGIALVTEAPQVEPEKAPDPEPPARAATPPAQRTAPRSYPVVEKPKSGNGAATATEVRAAATEAAKPQATVVVTPAERPKPQEPAAKTVEKQAEKKAKDRKQQQQQRAAAEAAAAAKAAEAARAKAAAETEKAAKAAKVQVEEVEKETWASKWTHLRENSSEALEERGWQKYAFAPESLAVIALLLCLAIGLPMWLTRKKSETVAPPTAAQTSVPAQTAATPAQTVNAPAGNTATPATPNAAEAQAKPQDQNAASKTQAEQAQQQQRDNPAPTTQVISPAPEAPRTVARNEEPAGSEPPPMVGAVPGANNGLGNIVKDVPVSVPKLAGQKLRVSSGVAQGQLMHQVTPQYPSQARQEHVQGTVVLQAVIAKDGSVAKLSVVSGPSQLTKAAMEAVKQWRYRPFALNGEPVEADTQINVNFKLGE